MDNPNGSQRYYIGHVNWTGFNGLMEYTGSEKFSAVLQFGTSSQDYQWEGFYTAAPDTKSRVVTVNGGYIKGGANYRANDNSNFFFNVGQIMRPPSFDGVFPNADYDFEEADEILNESFTSFELGYGFRSSNFKGTINAYHTVWGDRTLRRSTSIDDQGVRIIYSGVEQTHQGIEGEMTWYPSNRLRIKGMFSLGDWKYTKNFQGDAYFIDNNQPAGTTGTLYLDGVKIGDAAQTVLYLGFDYKLSSKLSVDLDMMSYDNLHGRFGPLDSEFNSDNNRGSIKLPSWGTADLGATYSFNLLGYDARARLNVNNLFDEEYLSQSQTNFHNDGGRTWNGINVENNVYFGKGTTWNLGLNINF